MTIKDRVHETTEFPEGIEVEFLPRDPGDRLDPEERVPTFTEPSWPPRRILRPAGLSTPKRC